MGFKGAGILAVSMLILAALSAPCRAMAGIEPGTAILDPAILPAKGRQHALLTVDAFGRYAVTVSSPQGVALQAVDRMSGSGPVSGEPGKRDGRLDMFLERGETRIVCHGATNGSGEAKLTAHPFRETNPRPPLLVEQRLEHASLDDFEQRSYWLDIKEERVVALEAAGRHLADLRLWRDGTWLVDAPPELERNEANPDQPLRVARLTAKLTPGLYLLTAYGGPSQAWTQGSKAKPFYLRWGMRGLPATLRQRMVMNDLGVERFWVPAGATYFRLELPSAGQASLRVGTYTPERPFDGVGASAAISKKSIPPVADLTWHDGGPRLVTVQASPGQAYVLQYFNTNTRFEFERPGEYWLASIHAGHADDSVGASAVLAQSSGRVNESYVDDRAVVFKPGAQWRRRFNLLDEMTLFVKLPKPGKIAVFGLGVEARYRFEPFLTSLPANYKQPAWQGSGHVFDLDAGLHVLTVTPVKKGILDLSLDTRDLQDDLKDWLGSAKSLLGMDSTAAPVVQAWTPAVASTRFPALRLEADKNYRLYLNQQPGVASGMVLRQLPIDLAEALPVNQQPGERLVIPVKVPEAGTLRALSDDGQALDIALSDGRKGRALEVAPGRYQVTVQAGKAALAYSLGLEPARLSGNTPLPPLPDARLAGLPKFPLITPDAPRYIALDRQSGDTSSVRVAQPGLYRFETTGLLRTSGKVRTRVNPGLFMAETNGVGHNFMIQRYLREGDYQLAVATLGETRGDLGVGISRADLVDGGELRAGATARALLPSGRALAYRLRVTKPGRYRLRAMGLGRNFAIRIEDEQGWPLDIANQVTAPVVGDESAEPRVASGEAATEVDGSPEETTEPPAEADVELSAAAPAEAVPVPASIYAGDAGVAASGDITLALEPGVYRAIIMPLDLDARVLTVFERLPEARSFEGHGPHRLALDTPVRHVWQEPFKGQPRISDHWRFSLPAPAELSIGIDAGMEANLYDGSERKRHLMHIPAGQAWRGTLPAGAYLLRVRHARGDSQVEYTLSVRSTHLLAGQERAIQAPARIPLSVAGNGLVVLRSLGVSDVRAKLLDATGAVIAQNDDQVDDWNFLIAQRLAPGYYTLQVDPSGTAGQSATTIGMRVPREIQESAPAWGGDIPVADGNVHVYTLAPPADANLLLASARADVGVGLALEGEAEDGWMNLGATTGNTPYLLQPLDGTRFKAYRLRVWAREWRGVPFHFRLRAANAPSVDEARWLAGDAQATSIDTDRPDLRVARIALARPGTFRVSSEAGAWRWTDTPDRAAESSQTEILSIAGDTLWLVSEAGTPLPSGARLGLATTPGQALRLRLAARQTGYVDVTPGQAGPLLAWARSRAAQPGIAFGPERLSATMAIAPNQAMAVRLSGAAEPVEVWNAASGSEPLDVDVSLVRARPGAGVTLNLGTQDLAIAPGEARACVLPPGIKSLGLVGSGDTLAVLLKAGAVLASYWPGGAALRETMRTDADQLWLINTGTDAVTANIEIAAGAKLDVLRAGGLVEYNMATSGRLRVPVEVAGSGATDLRLRVRGDVRAAWQEDGGRLSCGDDFAPRASGALWLEHGPGPLLAWLDGPVGSAQADAGLSPTRISPPATLALSGKQQLLAVHFEQPVMLHVRGETPLVSQHLLPGQAPRTEARLYGTNLNLMAPAKESRLLLRALGAAELSGTLNLHASPAQVIDEGIGAEVLLQPGGARLFSFEARREAAVGIGIRASSDVARGTLYDSNGALLGEGVVQMPKLKPGRYYLAVEIPSDSPPVRARPVLLGIRAPDTRPPYDLLRRYVEAGEDAPALIHDPSLPPEPIRPAGDADTEELAGEAGTDMAEE